jgi:hypothetical protein
MTDLNIAHNIVLKAVSARVTNTITSTTGGTYGLGYSQDQYDAVQLFPENNLQLSLSRLSAAGKLSFSYYDSQLNVALQMGDRIYLDVDGQPVFRGYLFEKRENKKGLIEATAYDCIRYMLNKDSYPRPSETYKAYCAWVASQFGFKFTAVNDQWDKVGPVVSDNESYLDVMMKYRREVVLKTGNFYEVSASRKTHGELIFRSMAQYPWKVVLTNSIVEDYEYTESIDSSDVANIIDIRYKTDQNAPVKAVTRQNSKLVSEWGPLWYIEEVEMSPNDAALYAAALLTLMGESQKTFRLTKCLTDTLLVEPGSPVVASFQLDNKKLENWMMIESIDYTIGATLFTADIVLIGNGISAK